MEPLEWLKETRTKELEEMAFEITKDKALATVAVAETFQHLNGLRELFDSLLEVLVFLEEFTKSVAGDLLLRHNQAQE